MSLLSHNSILLLALAMLLLFAEARPDPPAALGLSARLQAEGTAQCWESLMELRSCSGEVILFFLNGETYLGPSCCHAIRVIEHSCWAADAMLAAIGFSAQEGDILKGYCDAAAAAAPPPPPPPHHAAPGPASDAKPRV